MKKICDTIFTSHKIKEIIDLFSIQWWTAKITQVSWDFALQLTSYLTHYNKEKKEWLLEKINRSGKGKQIMESREFITYRWAEKCSLSASLPIFVSVW